MNMEKGLIYVFLGCKTVQKGKMMTLKHMKRGF